MFLAMLTYLVLVLVRPQDYPDLVETLRVPLLPIALLTAGLFWVLSGRKRFDAPQYLLLVMFFGVLMFSHVANGWFGGAVEQISKFAPTLLAFLVMANAASSPARVRVVMGVFTFCAALLALHGIEQVKLGTGWTGIGLSQGTRIQYVGIFNDPNDLGMLFVTCVPMACYLASRGGWAGLARIFWLIAALVLLYGIYLTNSRGTLLSLLVVMGVYLWWRRGVVLAGILGFFALLAMLALPSRFQEIDAAEASAAGRVDSWYEGLQMFREYPLFGVGAERYTDYNALTAHNSFVLVLAETGIVGFCVWIAFVGYCFRMMYAGMSQGTVSEAELYGDAPGMDSDPMEAPHADGDEDAFYMEADDEVLADDRAMAFTLFLALCAFFTAAFFLSRSYLVVLYLLAALATAHYAGMRDRNPGLPSFNLKRDVVRWPVLAVVGVVGLYVVVKLLLVVAS